MSKRLPIVAVFLAGVLVLAGVAFALSSHGHPTFPVRVIGRLVWPDGHAVNQRGLVMLMPDRTWATIPSLMRALEGASRVQGREPGADSLPSPAVHLAPLGAGGASLEGQGHFTVVISIRWTVHYLGPLRVTDSRPPPRHGLGVIRIEIEGRDPVILDVPHGTWTEHDDKDGLWATWDLGEVLVPGSP